MPLKSQAQFRKLAMSEPAMFERWQREHKVNYKDLPERITKPSMHKESPKHKEGKKHSEKKETKGKEKKEIKAVKKTVKKVAKKTMKKILKGKKG